jgi:hypothetical protein
MKDEAASRLPRAVVVLLLASLGAALLEGTVH